MDSDSDYTPASETIFKTPVKAQVKAEGVDDDMSPAPSSITKSGQPRKTREPRPKLMKWNDNDWKFAVLAIVHACGEADMAIPFEAAAKTISEHCTGGAFQQSILKLRSKLQAEGKTVPALKMSWTKKTGSVAADPASTDPSNPNKEEESNKKLPVLYRKEKRRPTKDQGSQSLILKLEVNKGLLLALNEEDVHGNNDVAMMDAPIAVGYPNAFAAPQLPQASHQHQNMQLIGAKEDDVFGLPDLFGDQAEPMPPPRRTVFGYDVNPFESFYIPLENRYPLAAMPAPEPQGGMVEEEDDDEMPTNNNLEEAMGFVGGEAPPAHGDPFVTDVQQSRANGFGICEDGSAMPSLAPDGTPRGSHWDQENLF